MEKVARPKTHGNFNEAIDPVTGPPQSARQIRAQKKEQVRGNLAGNSEPARQAIVNIGRNLGLPDLQSNADGVAQGSVQVGAVTITGGGGRPANQRQLLRQLGDLERLSESSDDHFWLGQLLTGQARVRFIPPEATDKPANSHFIDPETGETVFVSSSHVGADRSAAQAQTRVDNLRTALGGWYAQDRAEAIGRETGAEIPIEGNIVRNGQPIFYRVGQIRIDVSTIWPGNRQQAYTIGMLTRLASDAATEAGRNRLNTLFNGSADMLEITSPDRSLKGDGDLTPTPRLGEAGATLTIADPDGGRLVHGLIRADELRSRSIPAGRPPIGPELEAAHRAAITNVMSLFRMNFGTDPHPMEVLFEERPGFTPAIIVNVGRYSIRASQARITKRLNFIATVLTDINTAVVAVEGSKSFLYDQSNDPLLINIYPGEHPKHVYPVGEDQIPHPPMAIYPIDDDGKTHPPIEVDGNAVHMTLNGMTSFPHVNFNSLIRDVLGRREQRLTA